MEVINRWTLSCQGLDVNLELYGERLPLVLLPDDPYQFAVSDMGDGTLVLSIPTDPPMYATATDSSFYNSRIITLDMDKLAYPAQFRAIPTGDGYFTMYFPAFGKYVINNAGSLEVRGSLDEAARFTATGLDHDSILDLLRVGKSAPGMTFGHSSLAGWNLSGTNMSQCDLRNVTSLNGCRMNGTVLKEARLSGLHLDGLQMPGADCTGADFTDCDFTGFTPGTPPPVLNQANLTGAVVPGSLAGTSLVGAILAEANLTGADLSGTATNLTGASLVGVNLSSAQLSGAELTDADLTGATLAGTDFTGTDLTKVRFSFPLNRSTDSNYPTIFAGCTLPYAVIQLDWSCLDLTSAVLPGMPTDLTGLKAPGLRWLRGDFSGRILDGANFAHASLDQAVFTKAKLRAKPSFAGARLIGAVFAQAVLEHADFSGAALGGVAHEGAANFSYAYLSDCDFGQANLYGVIFTMATLADGNNLAGATNVQQTDFSGSYLPNTDFTKANLQGARFDSAFMIECTLTNADLSPAQKGAIPASLANAWLQAASLDGTILKGASLAEAFITDQRGQITYQYYGEDGKLTAAASMRYPAGSFPDPASFDAETLCPNNQTYGANQARGLSMDQMMASPAAPPQMWTPSMAADQLQAAGRLGVV